MRPISETDYIVIGAGSAGCVVANRLSADPAVKVTLIEAGGWDKNILIKMPAGFLGIMKTGMFNWRYTSVPQKHLNGRTMYCPRGKVMGGSSSINGLVYMRGHPSDFDQWAQLGNRGWSFDECLPYFKRAEGLEGGGDDYRGGDGPLRTIRGEARHPLAKAFIEAGRQAGYKVSKDVNGADQEGFGALDSTIGDGRRTSSASAYIHPIRKRNNLAIVTDALVLKVIVEKGTAVGVVYQKNGARHELRATREVILCGGAVNSPQLLQLSGIGDPDHLAKVGIKPVHELSGVGENLQDHLCAGLMQLSRTPNTLYTDTTPTRSTLALMRYALFRSGPASYQRIEAVAFIKTDRELVAPDIQMYFMMLLYKNHGFDIIQKHGFMPYYTQQRPHSRGSIRIRSSDPTVAPDIDPNYFEQEEDLRVMREGLKIARDIVAQKAFDPYRGEEYAPGHEVRTDAQIDQYLRDNVVSNYHLTGTCKMGSDPMAVVDDRLRVRGIDGLRVVDASIMPRVVSANTNASTIMIAEKASDYILGRHLN